MTNQENLRKSYLTDLQKTYENLTSNFKKSYEVTKIEPLLSVYYFSLHFSDLPDDRVAPCQNYIRDLVGPKPRTKIILPSPPQIFVRVKKYEIWPQFLAQLPLSCPKQIRDHQ